MNNERSNHRFLPHAVQNFLWGRARRRSDQQQQLQREREQRIRHDIQDREMTPVEEQETREQHPTFQPLPERNDDGADNRSQHSMPDLQSVSDADADSLDARDVEMHVVEDDHSHDWTDDDDNPPPLETVPPADRSPRSVRVEDEENEPRRHIHTHTTSLPFPPNPTDPFRRATLPPWTFNNTGASRSQPQSDFRNIFPFLPQRGPRVPPTPRPNPRPDNDPHPPPGPGRPHVHAHAYVLAIDSSGRPVTIHLPPSTGPTTGPAPGPAPQPQGMPMFDFFVGGGPTGGFGFNGTPPPAGDMPTWADVMQMFGRDAEEREDPERAKKLVAGLEEVPVGLVRRMIRVGGAPGGHVDEAMTQDSETPGCAVCWDTLLNEDDGSEESPQEQPKIISLPCSHVFHASCLIPWFSKPRHTTCPTCRFNIDPENLTHIPRRSQPRQPATPSDQPPPEPTQPEQPIRNHPAEEHPEQLQPEIRIEIGRSQMQPESTESEPTGFRPPTFHNTFPPAPQPPNSTTGIPPRTMHHGHGHGPGFTVDFTWQIPNNTDQDDERLTEDLNSHASAFIQQFLGMGSPPIFGGMPRMGSRPSPSFGGSTGAPEGQSLPRKEWSPPPAPGPTLRQRVECKEREAGLRCDDISCGIGPSDDDPHPSHSDHSSVLRQISISQDLDPSLSVCSHKFHPSCLVSADRCSGWGEREKALFEVVVCPMCRAVGSVARDVWDEGAQVLLA